MFIVIKLLSEELLVYCSVNIYYVFIKYLPVRNNSQFRI